MDPLPEKKRKIYNNADRLAATVAVIGGNFDLPNDVLVATTEIRAIMKKATEDVIAAARKCEYNHGCLITFADKMQEAEHKAMQSLAIPQATDNKV